MLPLAAVGCFQTLPPAALERLAGAGFPVNPRDGARIFAQGDPADAVYAITGGDGWVRIGSTGARAKALMAELFREGDIFGEMGVLDETTRSADAVVEGRVQLWRVGAMAFRDELDRTPALGVALARMLSQRLRRTYSLLQDATFESLEVRLAHQLLYLAALGGKPVATGIRLPGRFRQGDLADLLGATQRSIITILNGWRAREIVLYDTARAQLTIRDPVALRVVAQEAMVG